MDELRTLGGRRGERLVERLGDARRAFLGERFGDSARILRPLAAEAPASAAVRELLGLSLYRLGRYRDAVRELEAFRTLTTSTEQHPVLADSLRALGRHEEVEELWDELKAVSPSAALVAEGRIVMAGSLADRSRLRDAIALLQPAARPIKRPQEHHLRLWYALADLLERAQDLPGARSLFERVVAADPDFADAGGRLRALR